MPDSNDVRSCEIPAAFNSDRWVSLLALHIASEFKKDKYAECNTTGRTKVWIDGWQRAWTEAFIVLCAVLEGQYALPDAMLLCWVDSAVAVSWPVGSCVLRRWKVRETNKWSYGVCEIRHDGWGYGSESQFLLIESHIDEKT